MPNLRLRSTGQKGAQVRECPPKGESTEPLWFLRTSEDPTFEFGPGPLLFAEFWEEQNLTPSNIFTEPWTPVIYAPGTLQFNEPWELMVFVLGPNNFTEPWDGPSFNPVNIFVEPWTPSQFNPGPALFLEQWEAGHAWFKSEYWAFGAGGGGGG